MKIRLLPGLFVTGCLFLLAGQGCSKWQIDREIEYTLPPAALVSTMTVTVPVVTATLPPSPSLSPFPTPYPYFDPAGCLAPVEDYSLVEVNGKYLNQRTLIMLKHASDLFNGSPQYLLSLITQGSYHDNGAASWGTHLGGGAVDLSVMLPGTYTIAQADISPMIAALRAAGFAAWYRDADELYSGSAVHIHAIAVGDAQLSEPALAQLTSREGYFFGFNGLPAQYGEPIPDRNGGPVVCSWMVSSGYPENKVSLEGRVPWQQRLLQAAGSILTGSGEETRILADSLNFYPGTLRGMQDLEGPLVMKLLHDSSLVPGNVASYVPLPRFRLSSLDDEWRFWSQFPADIFSRYDYDAPVGGFDLAAWPLLPGDVVITSMNGSYGHLFMVTEGGKGAAAYSTVPLEQTDGSYLVERVLLYDPGTPGEGLLKSAWSGCTIAECANAGSFIVFRREDLHMPPGSLVSHLVRPGDTLPLLAVRYDSNLEDIIAANPGLSAGQLVVGERISVPVNTLAGVQ